MSKNTSIVLAIKAQRPLHSLDGKEVKFEIYTFPDAYTRSKELARRAEEAGANPGNKTRRNAPFDAIMATAPIPATPMHS